MRQNNRSLLTKKICSLAFALILSPGWAFSSDSEAKTEIVEGKIELAISSGEDMGLRLVTTEGDKRTTVPCNQNDPRLYTKLVGALASRLTVSAQFRGNCLESMDIKTLSDDDCPEGFVNRSFFCEPIL